MDRIIAGTVNADGSVLNGSEFTVSKPSKGHYLVSFRPAFEKISGGAVTQIYTSDGDTRDNAVIVKLHNYECYLKTGNASGDTDDRMFTFIFAGTGSTSQKA